MARVATVDRRPLLAICDSARRPPPPRRSKRLQEKEAAANMQDDISKTTAGTVPKRRTPRKRRGSEVIARRTIATQTPKCILSYSKYRHCYASVNDLPSDVLLQIFSYFRVEELELWVSRVCVRWKNVSREASVRRAFTLSGAMMSPPVGCEFLLRSPHLVELEIVDCTETDTVLTTVARHNRQLRRLIILRCFGKMGRVPISSGLIERVLDCCPLINELSIVMTSFRSNRFCYEINTTYPNVKKLNFNYSTTTRYYDGMSLFSSDTPLESFQALTRPHPEFAGVICCEMDILALAESSWTTLAVLRIDANDLGNAALMALGQCGQLRILALRHASEVTDEGLRQLLRLYRLEALDLMGMSGVSGDGWMNLFWKCNWVSMTNLNLSQCRNVNNSVIKLACWRFPKLQILYIAGCTMEISFRLKDVPLLQNLETLVICKRNINVPLLASLPRLRELIYHPCNSDILNEYYLGHTLTEIFSYLNVVHISHLHELL